jgi:hypothetical protein
MKKQYLITCVVITILAFFIHYAWEVLQMPLYDCDLHSVSHIAKAAFGDVLMTFTIWLIIIFRSHQKIFPGNYRPGDLFISGVLGLLFAIIFEQFAIGTGRWKYSELMPLFSVLNVGVVPLIQMTLLTPLIFFLTGKIINKLGN